MLKIRYSTKFKKDYRNIRKRNHDIALLEEVLAILCTEQLLPQKYRDHVLLGNYAGHRECHISSDWLLIYKIEGDELVLTRTGSHSDLF